MELERRVEAGLEAMLGIRFLASEYATGPWHRGRIDTLGLDENGSPVEFKKCADSGALSQAAFYLSWLCSARHEFEALVKEQLGSEVADAEPGAADHLARTPPRRPRWLRTASEPR